MLFALIINQFDFRLLEIKFHLKCVHSYTINKIFNIQMDIYDYHGQLHEYIYELAYEEASQTFSHSIISRYQKIPVWTFSNATNSFITSPNKITQELTLWSLSYIPLNDGKGRYSYLGEVAERLNMVNLNDKNSIPVEKL